jgi:hypothetical protein
VPLGAAPNYADLTLGGTLAVGAHGMGGRGSANVVGCTSTKVEEVSVGVAGLNCCCCCCFRQLRLAALHNTQCVQIYYADLPEGRLPQGLMVLVAEAVRMWWVAAVQKRTRLGWVWHAWTAAAAAAAAAAREHGWQDMGGRGSANVMDRTARHLASRRGFE